MVVVVVVVVVGARTRAPSPRPRNSQALFSYLDHAAKNLSVRLLDTLCHALVDVLLGRLERAMYSLRAKTAYAQRAGAWHSSSSNTKRKRAGRNVNGWRQASWGAQRGAKRRLHLSQ